MSPNEARVMVHLETHGPQTMNDLLALPRLSVKNCNDILERLLAAGQIERCAIGVQSGVKALTPAPSLKRGEGEISEVQTQARVAKNAF